MSTKLRLALPLFLLLLDGTARAQCTQVNMDYGNEHCFLGCDFYNSPFPGEHRRNPDGSINMHDFPSVESDFLGLHFQIGMIQNAIDLIRGQAFFTGYTAYGGPPGGMPGIWEGFGTTTGVYFKIGHATDPACNGNNNVNDLQVATLPINVGNHTSPPSDVHPTTLSTSTVFLINVDASSGSEFLKKHPVMVSYTQTAQRNGFGNITDSGTDKLLSMVPLQGAPLRPNTLYAAVVTGRVLDTFNNFLSTPSSLAQMMAGTRPPNMSAAAFASYRTALAALSTLSPAISIKGLTVFRTGDPTEGLIRTLADALSGSRGTYTPAPMPPPQLAMHTSDYGLPEDPSPFHNSTPPMPGIFANFCVYKSSIDLPQYQSGSAPYGAAEGSDLDQIIALVSNSHHRDSGQWGFFNGQPGHPTHATSRIYFTIPRKPMPAGGFPVAVYVRSGSGNGTANALVSKGPSMTPGVFPQPGKGPAKDLAQAGFAAVQIDDPLGGQQIYWDNAAGNYFIGGRNTAGWDEDPAIMNIYNLGAMRDNQRQSALELAVLAHRLPAVQIDVSQCPDHPQTNPACFGTRGEDDCATPRYPVGPGTWGRFDTSQLALMSHSAGSTTAPLAFAVEPMYKNAILSGAGASWLSNALYKQQSRVTNPIDLGSGKKNWAFREAEEILIALNTSLNDETAPKLNLLQWVGEPADAQVYNRITAPLLQSGMKHVLMIQGIIDHYIEPPIANAMSLSLGLTLATDPSFDSLDGGAPSTVDSAHYLDPTNGHDPQAGPQEDDPNTGVWFSGCNASSSFPQCGYAAFSDFRSMVPLDPMMDLSGYPYTTAGRSVLTLPVQGTATVIQKDRRIAGPYMDGHEVMFNDFTARKQVTAFLKSLLLGSGSPVVVQAMTEVYAGSEGPITCSHAPNVVGAPLADSCDCSVAMVCSDPAHNFCCRSEWSQSCVDYYHSRLPAINSDSTCNYLCASGTCNYGG